MTTVHGSMDQCPPDCKECDKERRFIEAKLAGKSPRTPRSYRQHVLPPEMVLAIYRAEGGQHQIAHDFGVTQSTVHQIKTGKTHAKITAGERRTPRDNSIVAAFHDLPPTA